MGIRVVFMGTPVFAKVSLERLYDEGCEIAGVFTQPDKPANRGLKSATSPVKELAVERGTPVFQPITLRNGLALNILDTLKCDLIVVVAYGKLLPREILDMPPLGCINIHGSLLPEYRGAAPIQWAVLNGDKETGVTSMYMAEELDAGDTLFSRKLLIGENETTGELYSRLSILGADVLSETIKAVFRSEAIGIPQNHSKATFAPPLKKDMSPIDWSDTAARIKNKVRGLNPWPIATAEFNGVVYKVFSVEIDNCNKKCVPGTIITADVKGLEVACADGSIIITELQAPGGKRMSSADYLRGHRV